MQGEYGHVFYVVTSGEAAAMRREVDEDGVEGEEVQLATLEVGACFGERALLRSEVRYASIVVRSDRLFTLFISRHNFEQVLGPLKALVQETWATPTRA